MRNSWRSRSPQTPDMVRAPSQKPFRVFLAIPILSSACGSGLFARRLASPATPPSGGHGLSNGKKIHGKGFAIPLTIQASAGAGPPSNSHPVNKGLD